MSNRFIVAILVSILLCAAAGGGTLAHADDLVQTSCSYLIDSAKARAEQQALDLFPHMLRDSEAVDPDTGSTTQGAGHLPKVMELLKARIPALDYGLAASVVELRGRIVRDAEDSKAIDQALAQTRPSSKTKLADLMNRKSQKTKHADELKVLLAKSEEQLAGDLAPPISSFNWRQTDYYVNSAGQGFDPQRLIIRDCSMAISLSYGLSPVAICGLIDLPSGETRYEVEQQESSSYGTLTKTIVLSDLGTQTPLQASKDSWSWAGLKQALREHQIAQMPEICKEPARDRFEKLAETEGVKSAPSSAPFKTLATPASDGQSAIQ